MLRDQDKKEIRNRLSVLGGPVRLVYFTQRIAGACPHCEDTERLLKEVVELSDRLTLDVRNFVSDQDDVRTYGVDKIPAIVVEGERDEGIRFYGMPVGYEFATFLEAVLRVSSGDSGFPGDVKERLKNLQGQVHVQVFVTPTCPYCPGAALTAVRLALAAPSIRADIVEISEFPHLAQKYSVMGVPKTVINETQSFEGALPEALFVEHVIGAVSPQIKVSPSS